MISPLTLGIEPSPAAIPEARQQFNAWLTPLPLGEEDRYDFLVAFGEAIINAVTHGWKGGCPVRVHCWSDPGGAHVSVVDQGPGFDPGAVPEPEPLAERGRGVWLMRRLASAVWSNGGRCVRLSVGGESTPPIPRPGAAVV